ncbi:hypothetical protein PsorP6_007511 [Peronosclerospora sorghi]|uniref:Uncharacterized protein n=1 Tax=Peronosclerospora sorghi TaxID=230839 RepID=A0ACC0W8N8_9STRA|nr:hypothetical protein PsorP6_007511 [Peronosclerospora sorghi]
MTDIKTNPSTPSSATSADPTPRNLAAKITDQLPSKESLNTLATLYLNYFDESSDEKTLECLRNLDDVCFLEQVLWPLADVVASADDCRHHVKIWVVSVILFVTFKSRQGNASSLRGLWAFLKEEDPTWKTFTRLLWAETDAFPIENEAKWSLKDHTALTHFLITCFASLDVPQVASSVLPLTSLSIWTLLSPSQRALEFQMYPKLERHWHRIMSPNDPEIKEENGCKRRRLKSTENQPLSDGKTAFGNCLNTFFNVLKASVDETVSRNEIVSRLRFIASFLALLIDLLSQLPTRRFLLSVLRRRHVRTALRTSSLVHYALQRQSVNDRQALTTQLALLDACVGFPIDSHTGVSFSSRELREHHERHVQTLQQCAFQSFSDSPVEKIGIVPCGHIASASSFKDMLGSIVAADRSKLVSLAIAVGVLADQTEANAVSNTELIDFFIEEYSFDSSKYDTVLLNLSALPTELDIWNEMLDQYDTFDGAKHDKNEVTETTQYIYSAHKTNLFPVLPVRKLGLQFLNLSDYLQRNYELLRLEAVHEIRGDLETAIKQLDAVRSLRSSSENDTIFRGFSQTAVPLISALEIVKVSKPLLGQEAPASVIAHVEVELSSSHDRKLIDCYQIKEVVLLVSVRATVDEGYEMMGFQQQTRNEGSFPEQYGVEYVRAAEIVEVADTTGTAINDDNPMGKGSKRVFKVALDGTQYKCDLEANRLDAYTHVNLLVRRKPRENNFKAVLDTLSGAWRNAKKEELLPAWLHDLYLGYGDPTAAHYKSIYKTKAQKQLVVPLNELLLDGEHALDAGGVNKLVNCDDETQELRAQDAVAPFTYVENLLVGANYIKASCKGKKIADKSSPVTKSNIRFTRAQVAAVRSGVCEGLTLIVGPPGTGKTDVAVQLVLNLYRSMNSSEKVLIVAHSNQALNDFFARILAQNVIPEAEIVRMGAPQFARPSDLPVNGDNGAFHADFSRNGRVAFLLERRQALLAQVEHMAQWLIKRDPVRYAGLGGSSASYSCGNALYFYQFYMKTFLDAARETTELSSTADAIVAFMEYYTMHKGTPPTQVEDLHDFASTIESYFTELQRLQPFELIQTRPQRGDLYLIHHARIVAMTCTHAALNYNKLATLGLKFSSLIMEEAAQISELDSFVPLLLACSKKSDLIEDDDNTCSGLKRLVLMGDTKQLPPVVKSLALKHYAHYDQSLFARLLRLGVPHIVLDRQGRSRSKLADIFRWRYDDLISDEKENALGDLSCVNMQPKFQASNPGFLHVAQFMDLSETSKERQSKPFSYENEEEARFVLALFRYMVGIGYRADQVSILTTYIAQKELLERLLNVDAPEAAMKCQVSTVDRFQGQQNDFILLSTVRSGTSVGHLRDVRRASTAFSRARLGLYVVGSLNTLKQTQQLELFVSKLVSIAGNNEVKTATKLALVPSERVEVISTKKKKAKKTTNADVVYISCRTQLEKVVSELKR